MLSGLWGGFNWRYDCGLVAGTAPCYGTHRPQQLLALSPRRCSMASRRSMVTATGIPLTADRSSRPDLPAMESRQLRTNPLPAVCLASEFTSNLVNDPRARHRRQRPQPAAHRTAQPLRRVARQGQHLPRRRYKLDLNLTAINFTNKYALYNFLSTFSGTHYVTPRALTAKVVLNF